jgi:MSHA biogenesis protein MshK
MRAIVRACVFSGFWACTAAHAALAQTLADPMRPPNLSGTAAGDVTEEAPRKLQSVLLSHGRKVAVINGEVVPLGGRIGDGVVAAISETEVLVKYPDHTETLKLLGDVVRTPSGGARPKGAK